MAASLLAQENSEYSEALATEALRAGWRPFERLAADERSVDLHGTSPAEVSAKLSSSEPFASELRAALGGGDPDRGRCLASDLLSETSVQALAGRLVLNARAQELHTDEDTATPCGDALSPPSAAGIYVILSTMNHSCDPTAEVVPHEAEPGCAAIGGVDVSIRTLREVAAGEPLTISYVPTEWPVEERRERLRHWGFECDCSRCEAEERVKKALAAECCSITA
eukprot:gnl/TRDRNA2_/TRDRNA2_90984_c0_seq2.p1 gnl/TRDRNA2_/TRDRNA2_90984_c0~~gnl/TRDRNA2_/TRDRNA2_90984_c0_seq2.p1  ORF type:complete len:243 (-),score=48.46 gnl/TRDRNA2_/TRDRNA2_90984_c0_seq2:28-699(-)